MNIRQTYDLIARDWHEDHKYDDWWIDGTKKFASLFKKDDLIFDVGCAGGTKSSFLVQKGLRVVGIDLSEEMIKIAKQEAPSCDFYCLDLFDAANLEYIFDGIFIQAVLLHIPKTHVISALQNLVKKLKPGGFLYIAVKEKRSGQPEEEVKAESDYGYNYQRFFSYYDNQEIESIFQEIGLVVVFNQVSKSGKTNWLQMIGQLT
ncbi:class I SAM-dependent methyltransferase [Patescibacteria group bacterium]|nr:class I SAM-dependent methyltransferase [Patescibacteria group bacterium]